MLSGVSPQKISNAIQALLKKPNEHTRINNLIQGLEEGVASGIKLERSASKIQFFSFIFQNHSDNYIDFKKLLNAFISQPDYSVEMVRFLKLINFNHFSEIDFTDLIYKCIHLENREELILKLLERYFELKGKLDFLFEKKFVRYVSIFQLILIGNYKKVIEMIKNHVSFKKTFRPGYLLSEIKRKENVDAVIKWVDLSQADIPFHSIKEDILLDYFQRFPDRLKKINYITYDDNKAKKNTRFKGNLYEYASYNKYHRLLNCLINENTIANPSVNSIYIHSLTAANYLLDENIHIINPELNIFSIEAMLQRNKMIPKLDMIKVLEDSVLQRLPSTFQFAVKNLDIVLSPIYIKSIFFSFAYANQPESIDCISSWLKQNNTKDKFNDLIIELFKRYLTNPGSKEVIAALLKYHSALLSQHFKQNKDIARLILIIQQPQIIRLLLDYQYSVPQRKIQLAYLMASVQGDEETKLSLSHHLELNYLDRWPYQIKLLTQPIFTDPKKLVKVYGTGISQQQYQYYKQLMISRMVVQLLDGHFKLMPNNIDPLIMINNYNLPLSLEEIPQNYLIRAASTLALEEKTSDDCTLFTLGAFRYWIAIASESVDAHDFGIYRKWGLFTASSERYEDYFQKFLKVQFKRYKDSKYLKINQSEDVLFPFPNCSIIGFINEKPVTLTTYHEDKLYGYGWNHTNPDKIPVLLAHCQTLINKIIELKIDNQNKEEIAGLCEKVGRLHWWLSHSCPFERGSASITEIICEALFLFHGLQIIWEMMPDCEGLVSPSEDDYAKNYSSLFKIISLPLRISKMHDDESLKSSSRFEIKT